MEDRKGKTYCNLNFWNAKFEFERILKFLKFEYFAQYFYTFFNLIVYCEQIFFNSCRVWIMWNTMCYSTILYCWTFRFTSYSPNSTHYCQMLVAVNFGLNLILSLEETSRKAITDSKRIFMDIAIYCQNVSPKSHIMQFFISISIFVHSFYCTFG